MSGLLEATKHVFHLIYPSWCSRETVIIVTVYSEEEIGGPGSKAALPKWPWASRDRALAPTPGIRCGGHTLSHHGASERGGEGKQALQGPSESSGRRPASFSSLCLSGERGGSSTCWVSSNPKGAPSPGERLRFGHASASWGATARAKTTGTHVPTDPEAGGPRTGGQGRLLLRPPSLAPRWPPSASTSLGQETPVRALGQEDALGGGHGSPLRYPCLENPMDRGAWWAAVHGVAKSRTRRSGSHFTFSLTSPVSVS